MTSFTCICCDISRTGSIPEGLTICDGEMGYICKSCIMKYSDPEIKEKIQSTKTTRKAAQILIYKLQVF